MSIIPRARLVFRGLSSVGRLGSGMMRRCWLSDAPSLSLMLLLAI